MAKIAEVCENCAWFEPLGATRGACHRYPPQVVPLPSERVDGAALLAERPKVKADDWCGEWKKGPKG